MSWLLVGLMAFPSCIGLLTIYHWLRHQGGAEDDSNVIGRIRLWWFALTRRNLFVGLFPWLTRDELENVNHL